MAQIWDARLLIRKKPSLPPHNVWVDVDFTVRWRIQERIAGQEYACRVELWADDPWYTGGDNRLERVDFVFRTNGLETQDVHRDFQSDKANEDYVVDDRVYCKVFIEPKVVFGKASATTNTCEGDF